jgi:hypothetical protein
VRAVPPHSAACCADFGCAGAARFQDARGDQCDACGKLLEPTALLQPRCKLTGTTPVLRATTHLYLDLPALSPQLQAYIDRSSRAGGWTSNCVQARMAAVPAPACSRARAGHAPVCALCVSCFPTVVLVARAQGMPMLRGIDHMFC